VPVATWQREDIIELLARRDIAHLLRVVQKETGASQTQIGNAIGLSQAQISEIMSGSRKVTSVDVLTRIVYGLDIPQAAQLVLFCGETARPQRPRPPTPRGGAEPQPSTGSFADVIGVYPTRSGFNAAHPAHALFDDAIDVRAAGLSLNLLCQQYSDTGLIDLLSRGGHLRLVLLDPKGKAIREREQEEGYHEGFLSSLNEINLGVLRRVRERVPAEMKGNLQVALTDETIRFNIVLVDGRLCVVQPYLARSRGVDSPTLLIERKPDLPGLFQIFEQAFESTWEGARPS
jgi:transcriptional regulator with XRE-family HTH domain